MCLTLQTRENTPTLTFLRNFSVLKTKMDKKRVVTKRGLSFERMFKLPRRRNSLLEERSVSVVHKLVWVVSSPEHERLPVVLPFLNTY